MMQSTSRRPKPVLLTILDGWGHAEHGNDAHNAFAHAKTPIMDRLASRFAMSLLDASEKHVGLPHGQMGNSEVGHMNIGSGRVVMQDLPRIDAAIEDGSIAENPRLQDFIATLKASGGACHLMGLLSPGGVHSHQYHMAALAKIVAAQGIKVWLHAFLDGRDTPPKSAIEYIENFQKETAGIQHIVPATIGGRYFAMDRDKRWDRVEKAYATLVNADAPRAKNAVEVIKSCYAADESDEFVLPTVLGDYKGMHDGDGLLVANFRADRVRQLLTALLDPDFTGFSRTPKIKFAATLGMVEYSSALNPYMPALFPPEPLSHILGEIVADAGMKQLRIAETEKYAHVTFFFNGGREDVFKGEDRILVPSPTIATYDLKPEMSAYEMTEKLVAAIDSEKYDLIVVNYANTDMVGHSGNIEATVQAIEAVDTCLGKTWEAVEKAGGAMLVTADHGNAEQMFDEETGQSHTAHTLNRVPFMVCCNDYPKSGTQLSDGILADIAPTVLALLGLTQPAQMTGKVLIESLRNA